MSNKVTKPEIKFKGFIDDWEEYKLGNIGITFTGLSGKTKEDFGHGQAQFITYMNVFSNPISKIDGVESVEIDKRQNEVLYGDIFFTTSSETAEEVGMSSVWLHNKPNIYLNSFCFGYRLIKETELLYIAYMLRSLKIRNKFKLLAQGISRYNISKTKVMEMNVFIPENKEQELIGQYFFELDNIINLHQEKYNKLINIKNSLLEKMFPKDNQDIPEIRFLGFKDKWNLNKLIEVAKYRNGKAHENDISEFGKYIVVNSKFISTNGKIKKFSNKQIEPLIKNEITFVLSDVPNGKAIARTFLIDEDNKYTLNQRIAGITLSKDNSSYFLYILMNRNKYFLQFDDGVKQTNLTKAEVEDFKTYYPHKNEQQKIGNLFKNIDNLISLQQNVIEKLTNIKKAMLEKMFI